MWSDPGVGASYCSSSLNTQVSLIDRVQEKFLLINHMHAHLYTWEVIYRVLVCEHVCMQYLVKLFTHTHAHTLLVVSLELPFNFHIPLAEH